MLPFWIILGVVTILSAIFNRPLLQWLGYKPLSEVLTTPNLKHSARVVEQLGRWLLFLLGLGFLVQGLNGILPENLVSSISFLLVGLSVLLVLIIVAITIKNWKAK